MVGKEKAEDKKSKDKVIVEFLVCLEYIKENLERNWSDFANQLFQISLVKIQESNWKWLTLPTVIWVDVDDDVDVGDL